MTDPDRGFDAGEFCYFELATTDPEAALWFYAGLLGWTFTDSPLPDGGTYHMARVDGKPVAGVFRMSADAKERPHWMGYVAVSDADRAAERATQLGARVIEAPFEVMDLGRMAVIADPTGAVLSVWQARAFAGVDRSARAAPGHVWWTELLSPDVDKASAFYSEWLGWRPEPMPMAQGSYVVMYRGETMAGGIMTLPPQAAAAPPNWMVYVSVADCDAAAQRAEQLGAQVLGPPRNIPSLGRFAIVMDRQGAVFAVMQLRSG